MRQQNTMASVWNLPYGGFQLNLRISYSVIIQSRAEWAPSCFTESLLQEVFKQRLCGHLLEMWQRGLPS